MWAAAGCERQGSAALAAAPPWLPCHCRKFYLTVFTVISSSSCQKHFQQPG